MFLDMPKIAKVLTNIEVNRITRPGWHAVGGVAGLLLQIREPASAGSIPPRSWILRTRVANQRQVIGLGPYPQVPLGAARDEARKLVMEARSGVNLAARKKSTRSTLIAAASKNKTFKECAESYMEAHASDYTSTKHQKQWPSTLENYAYPVIGSMLVCDISMRHVLDTLLQETTHRDGTKGRLWDIKTETAKRLLDRIRTVLDYATVNEYRTGTNPAIWKGYLDTQLPSPRGLKKVKHHPAIPYRDVGDFMVKLRRNDSISARALEFLILTSVRSGSVREANWSEIDIPKRLWTIPAEHTKAKKEHRVPLQPRAIELLRDLPRIIGTDKVFPSPTGKALSDMALSQLMRGMHEKGELKNKAVPHGFRSTFRDWSAECTNYPDEIRKVASMHSIADAVKEAYQRTDLLEKRRNLMEAWASFLDKPIMTNSGNISALRRK